MIEVYPPGTLLELTSWALRGNYETFPRGFYLIISSKKIEFPNMESIVEYLVLLPDGSVEKTNADSIWFCKGLKKVNPEEYE